MGHVCRPDVLFDQPLGYEVESVDECKRRPEYVRFRRDAFRCVLHAEENNTANEERPPDFLAAFSCSSISGLVVRPALSDHYLVVGSRLSHYHFLVRNERNCHFIIA